MAHRKSKRNWHRLSRYYRFWDYLLDN